MQSDIETQEDMLERKAVAATDSILGEVDLGIDSSSFRYDIMKAAVKDLLIRQHETTRKACADAIWGMQEVYADNDGSMRTGDGECVCRAVCQDCATDVCKELEYV